MKKIYFALATVLFLYLTTKAQTFEFDQVKQLPTIDNGNMDIIAASIQKLFIDAIKDPLKASTVSASNETVNYFYDSDDDRKLHKINPTNGKQYSLADSARLRMNQFNSYRNDVAQTSLLFNLTFDANGKLIVPEKINAISYRTEDVKRNDNTYIEQVGLLAFELIVTDSIKSKLSQVQLKTLAGQDVNSLTGGLKPVSIKCPFNLQFGVYKSDETKGHATKRGDNIDISLDRYFQDTNEKTSIISLLKEQTEILTYKKGEFDFAFVNESSYRNVSLNIVADNIIANRVSKNSSGGSSTKFQKVISFTGEGKKINK